MLGDSALRVGQFPSCAGPDRALRIGPFPSCAGRQCIKSRSVSTRALTERLHSK